MRISRERRQSTIRLLIKRFGSYMISRSLTVFQCLCWVGNIIEIEVLKKSLLQFTHHIFSIALCLTYVNACMGAISCPINYVLESQFSCRVADQQTTRSTKCLMKIKTTQRIEVFIARLLPNFFIHIEFSIDTSQNTNQSAWTLTLNPNIFGNPLVTLIVV